MQTSSPAVKERPLRVHVWVHDLLSTKGGIQTYSRHLLDALEVALGAENISIIVKNDKQPGIDALSGVRCKACGSWPRQLRSAAFAFQVFCDALIRRPDLIILTHLNFSPVAFWLSRIRRTPYWCIAHGVEAWNLQQQKRIQGLRGAARIFAVSSYTRKRILDEQRLSSDQVRLLPNTFRPNCFQPGSKPDVLFRRHEIDPNKKIILTVARLADSEKYKGYDQVLRAMPQILDAIPEAHYVLVGKGQDRGRIENMVSSLGLEKSVTLAGAVTDAELPDYYNLCDVFAMPSKGEGFGIVFLEALSCGKPVLAGNTDGSSDPLQSGRLGALVDPDDVAQIAETLIVILKGTYPLPVLYRPEELHKRTVEAFGPDRFTSQVRNQIDEFRRKTCRREAGSPKEMAACPPTLG